MKAREQYSRHYAGFRGVDFSSEQTEVHESRFAYLVNMYRDYRSGQGGSVETIPGFRKYARISAGVPIYGIHSFRGSGGQTILVHAGTCLYALDKEYEDSRVTITTPITDYFGQLCVFLQNASRVISVTTQDGVDITANTNAALWEGEFDCENASEGELKIYRSDLREGDTVSVTYMMYEPLSMSPLLSTMHERASTSFCFHGRTYIIDGGNYLFYDEEGLHDAKADAYIPTTYRRIVSDGENADAGEEAEPGNLLSPYVYNRFIVRQTGEGGDGTAVTTTDFYPNVKEFDETDVEVVLYDRAPLVRDTDYTVETDARGDKYIHLHVCPKSPEALGYPALYDGVRIRLRCADAGDAIGGCTVAAVFDNRVFLTGNPAYPNRVFFCRANGETGMPDPSYFAALDCTDCGIGGAVNAGMIPVSDSLLVLKGEGAEDGSVYLLKRYETGDDLHPVAYQRAQGICGSGCLGACINFLDDPIFLSPLGVEAIGQLSVRYERAMEHRSYLLDAKLSALDLSTASLAEWNGYLVILVNGRMFFADSRGRYTHDSGVMQYEWYYAEGLGVWEGQYREYRYASVLPEEYTEKTVTADGEELPLRIVGEGYFDTRRAEELPLVGMAANPAGEVICHDTVAYTDPESALTVRTPVSFLVKRDERGERYAAVCETRGNMTGGVFHPAVIVKTIGGDLYFGTDNGCVCKFNFDKRGEDGVIPPVYYSFDGRTIVSGCATKMDNCGIPHLTKSTVRRSTVVKTKTLPASVAKIKVRTNQTPYRRIDRISSAVFSFDNTDFSDLAFATEGQSLFSVNDTEKRWVEKQYYIYSDEYLKPFSLSSVSFRYVVAGRFKE